LTDGDLHGMAKVLKSLTVGCQGFPLTYRTINPRLLFAQNKLNIPVHPELVEESAKNFHLQGIRIE